MHIDKQRTNPSVKSRLSWQSVSFCSILRFLVLNIASVGQPLVLLRSSFVKKLNSISSGTTRQRDVLSAVDDPLRGLPQLWALRSRRHAHHQIPAQVPLHTANQEWEAEARADYGSVDFNYNPKAISRARRYDMIFFNVDVPVLFSNSVMSFVSLTF